MGWEPQFMAPSKKWKGVHYKFQANEKIKYEKFILFQRVELNLRLPVKVLSLVGHHKLWFPTSDKIWN